jgi:hypothetical protein
MYVALHVTDIACSQCCVSDAFVLKATVAPSVSFEEDVSSLPQDARTCATYVYRTDDKKGSNGWHWVLITFVPDHAPVSFLIEPCLLVTCRT